MRTITLTHGKEAKIDDDDYEKLTVLGRWHLDSGHGAREYAAKNIKGKKSYMHRVIMNPAKGLDVDHINGNGLDNRKENLRCVTRSVNNRNNHTIRVNSNRKTGVYWDNFYSCWKAEIKVEKRKFTLGSFPTMELALQARIESENRIARGEPAKIVWQRKKNV